ncbi:CHAP domain-containing protein [Streptomyces sp. NBC_01571]|uniref:CHAP domain-containing protein n=1 Tax=Streptomyces sp. NBC_01571 TaxID=2975883 RepID=UPI00224CC3CC|nr:CHAP domain-containing protein [Streptomyces sp. NBC_01571]MCX4572295.1 CHAP domain-containing protein [Streptomyces sp. NBC_01571]
MSAVSKVVSIAKAEVGYKEGRSGGHWNNKEKYAAEVPTMAWVSAGGYPWCALFVSWVALKAGVAALYPRSASCEYGVSWFKSRKRFSEYPAIGAQVFYGPGGGTHTGIVVSYTDSTITCVEGNTNTDGSAEGDGVYLKTRARKSVNVYGYGYPDFPEGIVSADPAWADKAPKPADKPSAPSAPATKPATPAKPKVSLAALVSAAKRNPSAKGTPVTYSGVRTVEAALVKAGLLSARLSDGHFGTETVSAYAAWQRRCGYSGTGADGVPGMATLRKLADKYGFSVTA